MPIVRPCTGKDCDTLTMGDLCLGCEQEREAVVGAHEHLEYGTAEYAAASATSRTSGG